MLTAVAVEQGNVVTEGLNAWFDFGNTECFNPTLFTGSISAGTKFNNLAPGQSAVSGTINGTVNWSTAYGGCMNLPSSGNPELSYTAGLSASFTTQIVLTPATDANASANWTSDGGAWPGYRPATNGWVMSQQNGGVQTGNYLLGVLWAGASAATLPNSTTQPASGWDIYARFPSVYTFTTNGSNSHNTYTNNILKATDTTTRTRGNSAVGQIYIGRDPVLTRYGTGRVVAYLHYNRQLSDAEIYQNVQFYLNRIGTR
jgi:hypothetical protein